MTYGTIAVDYEKGWVKMVDLNKKILETALLAGQIMTESNAESYRVEDTMNRILTTSNAAYAVAISLSTGLYITLDDPSFEGSGFTGIKRITRRSNNLNKITQVNHISRELTSGNMSIDEAYERLQVIRFHQPQYSKLQVSIGVVGLAAAFSFLFGGGINELIMSTMNGFILALLYRLEDKYYISEGFSNIIQALVVTVAAYLMQAYVLSNTDINIVIISTLMPMVPGTAITNSLRDIFHEDYIAGVSRATEAFLNALMIALGAALGLALIGGLY
ncbi:threonine/serine exporter [Aerococcus viridans]|uniref:Threonine/serine exporter n=2 Tax=Aerococcus viridans TaxID=1377 RepID=A0A2N6UDY4_9LACT|nr:threonine/serine exporter [Aerococcus viridans]